MWSTLETEVCGYSIPGYPSASADSLSRAHTWWSHLLRRIPRRKTLYDPHELYKPTSHGIYIVACVRAFHMAISDDPDTGYRCCRVWNILPGVIKSNKVWWDRNYDKTNTF